MIKEQEQDMKENKEMREYEDKMVIDSMEQEIEEIFMDILEVDCLPVDENFIALGGDSLMVQALIITVMEKYGVDLTYQDVIENLTPASLANFIRTKEVTEEKPKTIKAVKRDIYPMLPSQEHIYILSEMNATKHLFDIEKYYRINLESEDEESEGHKIDIKQLEYAINQIIKKYEIFRTTFEYENGKFVQKIHAPYEYHIHEVYLKQDDKENYFAKDRYEFNLHTLPLFHIEYIKTENKEEILALKMHHIITDGTSLGIFLKELKKFYAGENYISDVVQFKDYAAFREECMEKGQFEADINYWKGKFENSVSSLELGLSLQSGSTQNYKGRSIEYIFPSMLGDALDETSRRLGYSKFEICFAAYAVLLYRFSNSEQLVVGVPYANRKHIGLEDSMGMYINTLPLSVNLNKEMPLKELYEIVHNSIVEGSEHSGYYSEELLYDLQVKHDIKQLYQAVFIYQNFNIPKLELGEAEFEEVYQSIKYAKTDLTFEMIKTDEEMKVYVEYLKEVFREEDILYIVQEYERILHMLTENKVRTIHDLLEVGKTEREQILKNCTGEQKTYCNEKFIEKFNRSIVKNPDNIAICDDNKNYTYAELDVIISTLVREIESKELQDTYIGIYMEHGINQIIALLAVLKAGYAYLPIDKMLPTERVKYMVEDAGCTLLLVDDTYKQEDWYQGSVLNIDEIMQDEEDGNIRVLQNTKCDFSGEDNAYMIYTSGSTGQPKGIQVMQKNLTSYIEAFLNEFPLAENDVMLHQASIGFDASIEEIFPVLVVGGCIAVIDKKKLMDREYVKLFLLRHKVSILSVSPHLINEINQFWSGKQIHTFISGGDVLKKEYVNRLLECGKVYNTYGPTETTVCATYYEIKSEDKIIPIGKPILNYQVYILDESNNICPIGMEGEICISGAGVTKGYIGKEELTQKQFVKNPFEANQIMYRTRDLGMLLPDGNIKYMGRCDKQLNIRGFRIETGEIESHLIRYNGVEFAIVIGQEIDQELQLCAYLKGEQKYTVEELREYLMQILPEYMIPTYFVNIDEIPLNASGKVDTKKLPNPQEHILLNTEYVEAENSDEEMLCEIWREILNVEKVGVKDNFFSLGGQSLKAIQLIGRINEQFKTSKSIEFVFANKTIREQAKHICDREEVKNICIPTTDKKDLYLTSYMQKDMFAVQIMNPNDIDYNIVKAFRVKGILDFSRIKNVVSDMMQAHEILRTSFILKGQEVYQQISDVVEDKVSYWELNGETEEEILKVVNKPFQLSIPGLFHIYVLKEEEQVFRIVMVIHHMISDAISIGVLWEEFFDLYQGKIPKRAEVTYKDYAEWQNNIVDYEEARNYWNTKIQQVPDLLALPYDNRKEDEKDKEGITYQRDLPNSLVSKVNAYAVKHQLTPYMIYIGAYAIMLSKLCRQSEFCIGTPVVNRNEPDLFKVVGVFINTILQKFELVEEDTCEQFYNQVKKNTIEGLKHQEYPYYLLKEDAKRVAKAGNSLFNVMFSLIEFETDTSDFLDSDSHMIEIESINVPSIASMFDLTLELLSTKDAVTMNYEYRADLFETITIERMADMFIWLLETIVTQPQLKIKDIDICTESEKNMLFDMSRGKVEPNSYEMIWETIEKQMEQNTGKVAICDEGNSIIYEELKEKVDRLASLLQTKQVGESGLIAIYMDPSISRIISILAIMKAGYGYLPMDKSWPQKRIQHVLEDSKTNVLLTDDITCKDFILDKTIMITTELEFDKSESCINVKVTSPSDTAYVIYTSGSSGVPKGVRVTHRNLASYVQSFLDEFPLNSNDVVLHQASIAFDSSIEEIFPALCVGGCIAIASKETIIDTSLFVDYLKQNNVSVISASPYLINELNQVWDGTSIHTFISGGDILRKNYVSNLLKYGKVYNTYGPTETTVCATYYHVTGEEKQSIPIGKPIRNAKVYILDDNRNLAPIGTVGEICITGYGVTNGYLNREDLTTEKFVTSPFNSEETLYLTGDLGRVLYSGDIEYIGRKDAQINIRGYRVELGEIESCILNYDGVSETIVVFNNIDEYLCAYIRGNREYNVEEMKRYLGQYLPAYMVPSFFVNVDHFPFNSSGKIDKAKLPNPFDNQLFEVQYAEPETKDEIEMAQIWSTILGIKKVGRNDNFFNLGGQSLKAIILCNEIEQKIGIRVPTSVIFKYPILSDFCKQVKEGDKEYTSLSKVELETDTYEASMQQKNIYILQSMAEGTTHYNMPAAFKICGDIQLEYLQDIIQQIIFENPIFRTSFEIVNNTIVQKLHRETTFKIDYYEDKQDVDSFIQKYIRPFDLSETPLIRCGVQKIREQEYVVLIDIHHIISDGASIQLFMEDVFNRYSNQAANIRKYKYIDYSEWQKEFVNSDTYLRHAEYWKNMYEIIPETLSFPTDYVRQAERSYQGNSIQVCINKRVKRQAEELIKNLNTTNFMLYFGIYGILLNKYSGQNDIVIGIPTLGRNKKEVITMYGNFVNTLAIRTPIDESISFAKYIEIISGKLAEAYDHQDVPFHEVINGLALRHDSSRNPLFDTMFSYLEDEEIAEIEDLEIDRIPMKYNTAKFDFGLDIIEGEELNCILNYATDLFEEDTMKCFLQRFEQILKQVTANPTICISDIELLSQEEKLSIVEKKNETDMLYDENRPIIYLMEEQCLKLPNNIAIVCAQQQITYRELYNKTNAFAKVLRNSGINKGDYVPIMMERSVEVVVAIYSVMKLGAIFVPLDVNWPEIRIQSIVEELDAKCLVTNEDSYIKGKKITEQVICCNYGAILQDETEILEEISLDDSIYVIYTSGSTGKPKGVEVYHRGILNRFLWMNRYFGADASMSVLQTTNHMYDSSVWQFFWPMINGGKTVIPDTMQLLYAEYVVEMIEKNQISMIDFVPSVFKNIVYQLNSAHDVSQQLSSLKCVILGGEEIVPKAVDHFKEMLPGIRVFNLYGPTEASIGCICHEVVEKDADIIPIGKPIDNVKIYLLDKNRHIVPVGVPGEIYIAGECIAKGYFNDEDRTNLSFVKNPYNAKYTRMYKTGDIAKYGKDGKIFFLGRVDEQVKIRGFRIELGEIETAIRENDGVEDVQVILQKLDNGEPVICAYIIGIVSEKQLKKYLTERLPYYMVPGFIQKMESFPIAASGKLDKNALPKPHIEIVPEEVFQPKNEVEEKLLHIYEELLHTSVINSNLSFFEQGGNSLSATMLVAKVNQEFTVGLKVSDIFLESRIQELAKKIQQSEKNEKVPVKKAEKAISYEASPAQKRMYVMYCLDPHSLDYNMPMLFKVVSGVLDKERLEGCIHTIVDRHEIFRTNFQNVNGILMQFIDDEKEIFIEEKNIELDVIKAAEELIKPFDLDNGPLLRICKLYSEKSEYLFIDMHHIISDGVSVQLLMNEIHNYWTDMSLEAVEYQYKDFSKWHNEYRKHEQYEEDKKYWLNQFASLPQEMILTERANEKEIVHKGEICISQEQKHELDELIKKEQITPYMFYLAVLYSYLYHVTSLDNIAIGTPVSGRTRSEFESTIGLFVNTIVLNINIKKDMTFHSLIKEVKQLVINGMEHQEFGFDDLVDELKISRNAGKNPLFNMIYSYEKIKQDVINIGDVHLVPITLAEEKIKFHADVMVREYEKSVVLCFECKGNFLTKDEFDFALAYLQQVINKVQENMYIRLDDIVQMDASEFSLEEMEELQFEFEF